MRRKSITTRFAPSKADQDDAGEREDFLLAAVVAFTPFQVSVINLGEFIEKRSQFGAEEWMDVLVNSCGLDPASMSRREKLLYLCRCVPLVVCMSS